MDSATSFQQRIYEMLMESQYWPPEQILAFQRNELAQLLLHARQNVPFYETRLDPLFTRNGKIDWDRWEELPILSRKDLFDHRESMQALAAPVGHGQTQVNWSSGTTGQPIDVTQNGLAFLASRAAMARANTWHNIDPSKTSCDCIKGGRDFALWPDGKLGGTWGPAWDQNATGRLWHLNRQATPEQLVRFMQEKQVSYLGTRPKTAHAAALEALRLKLPHKLDAILGHGTGITEEEVEDCRSAFGARIVGLYSSTECHKIAHPCPDCKNYHVNAEIALLEIVGDDGRACAMGTPGRVVITPLLNTAQPLIRYDQGDTAITGEPCGCGRTLPVLAQIIGRTSHLFRLPDGRRLSLSVPPYLKKPLGTETWQLAQVAPLSFEVRYVEYLPVQPGAEDDIVRNMRDQLGEGITVRFVKLDEVPLTASGKFLENVCELKV